MSHFRGVLFDWRGTLFYDQPEADWLRASAATLGQTLSDAEIARMLDAVTAAESDPRVIDSRREADCSLERNRAAAELLFEVAGIDAALGRAVWQRDGDPSAIQPYPDSAEVLRALRARAARIAVVSDIHYDLRPLFAAHGLDELVDAFVLSFEHGVQKPDARLFEIALRALDVRPAEALMVGDRASRDGGALAVGITTLLLPTVAPGARRGLDSVLGLVGR